MPLQVFDKFYREMLRYIKTHYAVGDRFLSTRQIAEKFDISLQTAQKGVKKLSLDNMVKAAPKSGITVMALEPVKQLEGKKIVIISNKHDKRFNQAFLDGAAQYAKPKGVLVELMENTFADSEISSLAFGDHLLKLQADGIIALAFSQAALGFYHAMREGLDMAVDIILDELPPLPSVQTDNFKHSHAAAQAMVKRGYTRFLIAGYYPQDNNRRYEGFISGLDKNKHIVNYACLANPQSMVAIDHFFYFFSKTSAVFSCDYATNYILAAKFLQHGIQVKNDNFMVYDSEDDVFTYAGINPVTSAAPSLKKLGEELCKTIIYKWENGKYPEPLIRKI
jgi:DNA-binding LacI/PurR family transcriptional regulator